VIRPFGRGSCIQHGQISTLGRSNNLAGATTCTPVTPDHSATIGGHVGSAAGAILHGAPQPLPLGPAAAANAPLPGMLQRAWPCALRCHHRSAQLHHRRAFRAIGHSPCCRRRRRRSSAGPAVARRPPRGFAAQVHQLALAWRPGKGTGDAPFLGGDPRAICGHPGQARAAHSTCMLALLRSSRFALNLSR